MMGRFQQRLQRRDSQRHQAEQVERLAEQYQRELRSDEPFELLVLENAGRTIEVVDDDGQVEIHPYISPADQATFRSVQLVKRAYERACEEVGADPSWSDTSDTFSPAFRYDSDLAFRPAPSELRLGDLRDNLLYVHHGRDLAHGESNPYHAWCQRFCARSICRLFERSPEAESLIREYYSGPLPDRSAVLRLGGSPTLQVADAATAYREACAAVPHLDALVTVLLKAYSAAVEIERQVALDLEERSVDDSPLPYDRQYWQFPRMAVSLAASRRIAYQTDLRETAKLYRVGEDELRRYLRQLGVPVQRRLPTKQQQHLNRAIRAYRKGSGTIDEIAKEYGFPRSLMRAEVQRRKRRWVS